MIRLIVLLLIYVSMLSNSMSNKEDPNIQIIREFQECRIYVYHAKGDGFPQFKMDHPITLPTLKIPNMSPALSSIKSWKYTLQSAQWTGYLMGRRFLQCTSYLLISPETWESCENKSNKIFLPETNNTKKDCFFWYRVWRYLMPFRDGVDFLLISTEYHSCKDTHTANPHSASRPHPIINNILFFTSHSPHDLITFYTYQNSRAWEVFCKWGITLSCIRQALAYGTSNGTLLGYENAAGVHTLAGFLQNTTDGGTIYKRLTNPTSSPFNQPFRFYGVEENFQSVLLEGIKIWMEARYTKDPKVDKFVLIQRAIRYGLEPRPDLVNFMLDRFSYGEFECVALVPVGMQNFLFCTKHGVAKSQSIAMYFEPYDLMSWTCMVMVLLIISILYGISNFLFSHSGICNQSLNILLLKISILLSASPDISKHVLSVRPKVLFHFTIGFWLLFVIILTNAYVGVVVSKLTIPPPWVPKWTRLNQLESFVVRTTDRTLVSLKGYFAEEIYNIATIVRVRFCPCLAAGHVKATSQVGQFRNASQICRGVDDIGRKAGLHPDALPKLLMPSLKTCALHDRRNWPLDQLQIIDTKKEAPLIDSGYEFKNIMFYIFNDGIWDPRTYDAPKLEKSILGTYNLIKEGRKVAIFDEAEYVRAFVSVANKYQAKDGLKQYATGTADFRNLKAYVVNTEDSKLISDVHARAFITRIQLLVQNGIRDLWLRWYSRRYPSAADQVIKKQNISSKPKALNINTNVMSIFVILLICIALCILELVFEMMDGHFHTCCRSLVSQSSYTKVEILRGKN